MFADLPLMQPTAASLMHPFSADVALTPTAVAAELAIAVLLALTLLWLALVAVLGEASWLVLFKVPLGVPTLMLSLELCMGQTRRPMNVVDVAVLCGVLLLLVVEAF